MNVQNSWFLRLNLLLAPVILALGLAGCATPDYSKAMVTPPLATNTVPIVNVGDNLTITLSGLPYDADNYTTEKSIKEDGTITLPTIGRISAAGKNVGELEDDIHNRYVPAYYTHCSVTVKTGNDLVYFVRGEVKAPGRLIYVGSITVTKAITSAGDFTDFANRKKVILTRASGPRFKLNCNKILDGQAPDPPVFPGDQIEVPKRWW